MNEEIIEEVEQVETVEETGGGESTRTFDTFETPTGNAVQTIEVNPTTGEPFEGIEKADFERVEAILNSIDSKTITTTSEGVPLSLTYDQGEQIIGTLQSLENAGITVIMVCLVVFVFRWVYKFFNGTLFGGL